MTKKKAAPPANRPLVVQASKDESQADTMARVMAAPFLRHGILSNAVADKMVGKLPREPRFDDYGKALKARAEAVQKGDLSLASELLTAQALTLDAMFTELARRSALNMGDYIKASETYARLALKAQANSRATIEALVRLHQPREQTVKHVHVNQGAQRSWLTISTITRGLGKMEIQTNNPMQFGGMEKAPRCLARTRSGKECQSPAVKGKRRCRMHGGTNPGPPRGNQNAWKHGARSAKAIAASRYVRAIAQLLNEAD